MQQGTGNYRAADGGYTGNFHGNFPGLARNSSARRGIVVTLECLVASVCRPSYLTPYSATDGSKVVTNRWRKKRRALQKFLPPSAALDVSSSICSQE